MHNDQQGSALFCLHTCHKRLLPERGNAQTFGHSIEKNYTQLWIDFMKKGMDGQ